MIISAKSRYESEIRRPPPIIVLPHQWIPPTSTLPQTHNVNGKRQQSTPKAYLPTNHGFRGLFSTFSDKKYSLKPSTGLAWGWTDNVPSTSASFPSETRERALQPSEPIQENQPVALQRRTAFISSATS
ncbi:hypothetical protein GWI33_005037 [Rhynchophorus ferrugineus]|uniref:Uncharacterized protein n=1 Tax=Rhynchophorus ferrugineus TaxID=354439 RepID=A0A834MGC8_RHYFE|nr:hypothetical protein GWI33_005037 [Rhynchophorus ferrugineus]